MVPALVGLNVNVPPCPKSLLLNDAPDSAVTLWSTPSSLTHFTVWPTFTARVLGANWIDCILIVTSPAPEAGAAVPPLELVEPPELVLGADELLLEEPLSLLLPQPAAASASRARRRVARRA